MIVAALAAGFLIVALVAWQSALLTVAKRRQPAPTVLPERPRIPFRKDPQGWMVDVLRRRKGLRLSLSLGSLVAFLFAVGVIGYPFYTNLVQSRIQQQLDRQFASPELKQAYLEHRLQEGDSLTRIKIPAIDVDVVVVEGTGADALRAGAGHYRETALPCEDGTVGIAGHRTTYGRPFANIDLLKPGDTITLETPIGSCTYQVLPPPPKRKAADSNGAAFIIQPNEIFVIAGPTVARAGESPPPAALLTLTTCHPKGSAAQRLVVQAVLVTGPAPPQPGA
ncbi:MAG: sortase [Acidimicrobiaceae bacterium]|jgi:sortase A